MGKAVNNPANFLTVSEVLFYHVHVVGTITAKQLAQAGGVALTNAVRWTQSPQNGGSVPSLRHWFGLLAKLPRQIVDDLRAVEAAAVGRGPTVDDRELDVNRDGRVDLDDALDSDVNAMRAVTEAIEQVRRVQQAGHSISEVDAMGMLSTLNKGHRALQSAVEILKRHTMASNGSGDGRMRLAQ